MGPKREFGLRELTRDLVTLVVVLTVSKVVVAVGLGFRNRGKELMFTVVFLSVFIKYCLVKCLIGTDSDIRGEFTRIAGKVRSARVVVLIVILDLLM